MAAQGDSAVVVPVPAADALVGAWRARLDPSAAKGMPAHVTVLVPFLREARLTAAVCDDLAAVCARTPVLRLDFRALGRFPQTLYLAPEPAEPLRALTLAVAARWPEAPPYGGQFPHVVPHLTVGHGAGDEALADAERALAPELPLLQATADAAVVYVFDGVRWEPRARLPFGRS